MTKPYTPADARAAALDSIPDFVIEAVNRLIAANLSCGRATFNNRHLLAEITNSIGSERATTVELNQQWLNFPDLYRSIGWKVQVDTPGFNENYFTIYTFIEAK